MRIIEYEGAEVYRVGQEGIALTSRSDLQPGDAVIVPTLLGSVKMTVVSETRARNELAWANLDFDKDDRHCWTSDCYMPNGYLDAVNRLRDGR